MEMCVKLNLINKIEHRYIIGILYTIPIKQKISGGAPL